jgi:hypothetical protein
MLLDNNAAERALRSVALGRKKLWSCGCFVASTLERVAGSRTRPEASFAEGNTQDGRSPTKIRNAKRRPTISPRQGERMNLA